MLGFTGVQSALPIHSIEVIWGNDLAGNRVLVENWLPIKSAILNDSDGCRSLSENTGLSPNDFYGL